MNMDNVAKFLLAAFYALMGIWSADLLLRNWGEYSFNVSMYLFGTIMFPVMTGVVLSVLSTNNDK
jgi:hypothetical protein